MRKKNILLIAFAGLLIFSFSSADNAVSPLVQILHQYYAVPMSSVLLLISSCTFGIVVGTFLGPIFIADISATKVLIVATLLLAMMILLFIFTKTFGFAILWRTLFGFFAGILANIMWWLTFQYTKGKTSDAMVVMLMTARPAALCLGVPLAGFIAAKTDWQHAFFGFFCLCLTAGMGLYFLIKKYENQRAKYVHTLLKEYSNIFKLPYSFRFYLGITLNACGYFGFYAFAGIWFIGHYQLTLSQISMMFLFMGGGEIIINFVSPWLYRCFIYHKIFTLISIINIVIFGLFINAYFPASVTFPLIVLFIMSNRVFLYPIIRNIPIIFKGHENKTTLGSLVTLTMWLGFAVISWLQSKLLPILGINYVGYILFISLGLGVVISYFVQKNTVFKSQGTLQKSEE